MLSPFRNSYSTTRSERRLVRRLEGRWEALVLKWDIASCAEPYSEDAAAPPPPNGVACIWPEQLWFRVIEDS
jgi:ketosteroid isomerase-like protein